MKELIFLKLLGGNMGVNIWVRQCFLRHDTKNIRSKKEKKEKEKDTLDLIKIKKNKNCVAKNTTKKVKGQPVE